MLQEEYLIRYFMDTKMNGIPISSEQAVQENRKIRIKEGIDGSFRNVHINYNYFMYGLHMDMLESAEKLAKLEIVRSGLQYWNQNLKEEDRERYDSNLVLIGDYEKVKRENMLLKQRNEYITILQKQLDELINN